MTQAMVHNLVLLSVNSPLLRSYCIHYVHLYLSIVVENNKQ